MDVEYIDDPQYPPIDWPQWMLKWCDTCQYNDGRCDAIWEMAINGWSSRVVTVGESVECRDYDAV
jgi:hypothetical protein